MRFLVRPLLFAAALSQLTGCGESGDPPPGPVTAVAPEAVEVPGQGAAGEDPTSDEEAGDSPIGTGPAYALHEWGLIDVPLTTGRVEFAAGPGTRRPGGASGRRPPANGASPEAEAADRPRDPTDPIRRPEDVAEAAGQAFDSVFGPGTPRPGGSRRGGAHSRKPVIYLHRVGPSTDPLSVDITVRLAGGRVVEHFPTTDLGDHPETVTWSGVAVGSEHCAGGPYPLATDPLCTSVADGYCEAAELGRYAAEDAACLTVRGAPNAFLFYRGDSPTVSLPLTITRAAGGEVTVRNDSLETPIGALLRLRRRGGVIQATRVAIPAVGESISVAPPASPATDAHRAAVSDQLRTLGLSDGEVGAFERAWYGELFEADAATPHAFPDAILYFLPMAAVDSIAHLDATPAPVETYRAIAVRAGWPTL